MSDTPVTAPADADDTPDQPISTTDFQADPEPAATEPAETPEVTADTTDSNSPDSEAEEAADAPTLRPSRPRSRHSPASLPRRRPPRRRPPRRLRRRPPSLRLASRALSRVSSRETRTRGQSRSTHCPRCVSRHLRLPHHPSPRDPAVDADLETEDEGLTEALNFFGISN